MGNLGGGVIMPGYSIYAVAKGKEYIWIKGTRKGRIKKRTGKLKVDIFCRECKYNKNSCGYSLTNCPYRKISQKKYLNKHGHYQKEIDETKL
jgi:hypothetical protein